MGKLLAVIKREYIERVRNKWFIIVTIFGPVFFGAVMILPAVLSIRGIRNAASSDVRVVDATGTDLGARLARQLVEPPRSAGKDWKAPKVTVDTVARDGIVQAESLLVLDVMAKRATGFIVLDSLTVSTGNARYLGRNASSVGENQLMETALRRSLMSIRLSQAGLEGAAADSIGRLRVDLATEKITDEGKAGSGFAGMIFGFVVAFMLYMSLILYGQAVLRGVLEEKTTRVAEVIVASVKPDILLAGKVIGVGAVGLTQYAIWIASGVFFWTQRMQLMSAVASVPAEQVAQAQASFVMPTISPFTILALLLFFLFGYTFYASLFAAVGSMVSSQEEANQAVQPVVMLLVFSVIFMQPVASNPTGTLSLVMSRLPFSAPIIMPLRMTATPVPAYEVVAVLIGVGLAAMGAIWLAARIYRVGLLMYGKRPSLRELGRWIRQS